MRQTLVGRICRSPDGPWCPVIPPRYCKTCGHLFRGGHKKTRHCCAACYAQAHGPLRSAIARSRRHGFHEFIAEKVNPYSIFSAAAWTCQACGKPTPEAHRGTKLHDAPELDHIVPICIGGHHEPGNLQLLCRECHADKSARPPESYDAGFVVPFDVAWCAKTVPETRA